MYPTGDVALTQSTLAEKVYLLRSAQRPVPETDGNGRIGRVMMTAELGAKGLSKIIIPTVYRDDYMGSLKKLTKQRDCDAYIRMLLKAWQFSSNVYDDNLDKMEAYLTNCDAFLPHEEGKLKIIPGKS